MATLKKHLTKSMEIFRSSEDSKHIFECMSNILCIFERNLLFVSLPAELATLVSETVLKLEKEHQYPIVAQIKKLIRVRNLDIVG